MAVIALFRDLLARGLPACGQQHPAYFAGLEETYGPGVFGPAGLAGAAALVGPAALGQIARVAGLDWEGSAGALLDLAFRHLPGPAPDVWLGILFFLAPAATLDVGGRPAIAVGLESFDPEGQGGAATGPAALPGVRYSLAALAEMIPHEAAHAVRAVALGLSPSPRRLTLREMLLLEGTALLFTDTLLGRATLPSFMPAAELARHQALEPYLPALLAPDLDQAGTEVFLRYFGPGAPVSGYCAGLALCRRYAAATGTTPAALVTTPTARVLGALGL